MTTVIFASGYESIIPDSRCCEVFHCEPDDEWWVEITQRQNPYNLDDEPIAVVTSDCGRIDLDEDGAWMDAFQRSAIWSGGRN